MIAKGELARPLPPNATPEQLAAYRTAQGIPEKAEAYWDAAPLKEIKLEDGDRDILGRYLPLAHELNLKPDQVAKFFSFRQAEQERQIDEQIAADHTARQQTEDALRQEWGTQYRQNIETMRSFLEQRLGPDMFTELNQARLPNGQGLVHQPEFLRAMLQMALDLNGGVPTITTADGKGIADGAGVDARMREIEGLMKDQTSKYWKGPEANAIQAEYRQLIEYKERNAARGGRAA